MALSPVTIAPSPALVYGNSTVFQGDSTTQGSSDQPNGLWSDDWPALSAMLSNGKLINLRNAGVTGDTTGQMLARILTDVVAFSPANCWIMGGTNDVTTNVALSVTQSNIIQMCNTLRSKKINPILCTILPNNNAVNGGTVLQRHQNTSKLNQWIQRYAMQQHIPIIDFYALFVDPSSGGWRGGSTYTSDGTHPTLAGRLLMAQFVTGMGSSPYNISQLGLYPQFEPFLIGGKDDTNIISGGLFLTNTAGVGTGFIYYGDTANATASIVTDSAILGNWQQIAYTGTSTVIIEQDIGMTGISIGDRLAFSGIYETSGVVAGGCLPQVRALFTSGAAPGQIEPIYHTSVDFSTATIFYMEGVVPSGTTGIQIQIICNSATGTIRVGRLTLLDLTTLGGF